MHKHTPLQAQKCWTELLAHTVIHTHTLTHSCLYILPGQTNYKSAADRRRLVLPPAYTLFCLEDLKKRGAALMLISLKQRVGVIIWMRHYQTET